MAMEVHFRLLPQEYQLQQVNCICNQPRHEDEIEQGLENERVLDGQSC